MIPSDRAEPEVVLDISRLVSRVLHATPTGVDRVEMAYAEGLADAYADRLSFAAVHPSGLYGRIPRDAALRFLEQTRADWNSADCGGPRGVLTSRAARLMWQIRPRKIPPRQRPRVYVQSSPHHLDNEGLVRSVLRREGAAFVCLIHDLIPIEYPEYAREGGAAQHLRRIQTVARLADAVVANSQATLRSFLPFLRDMGRDVPVVAAHLGLDAAEALPSTPEIRPYFLCLGTIEPRKNHLLLLHLWRAMAEEAGAAAVPKLLIVGRRGWENEQVLDLLDRCPALEGCVEERAHVGDAEMRVLVAGARALLMPSFAEGYGLPVPEALALGVPVICSDLPALREAGGNAPVFLDPLDGPGWRQAIDNFTDPAGPARRAFAQRCAAWRAPTWKDHVRVVVEQIEGLT